MQFGNPQGEYITRPGAYVVIIENDSILALNVQGVFHLPGGGIDDGEEPQVAALREVQEETGSEGEIIKDIGQANQFYKETRLGPMNKIGHFFEVKLLNEAIQMEDDHEIVWIPVQEFLNSNAADFQKWAVEQCIKK